MRGQGFTLDPVSAALAEERRLKAQEYQQAIRIQMMEKQQRQQAERERKKQEEEAEERRLEAERARMQAEYEEEQQRLKQKAVRSVLFILIILKAHRLYNSVLALWPEGCGFESQLYGRTLMHLGLVHIKS